MAYVQCLHCRRSAVTSACSSCIAQCARCGAQLPNPAGCATSTERHLRLLPEPTTLRRTRRPVDDWPRVAA